MRAHPPFSFLNEIWSDCLMKRNLKTRRTAFRAFSYITMATFLQILEGPKDVVVKTYDRILHDPRHKGLIRLLSRFFPSRSFSDWSMGYVRCTEKKLEQNAPGFNLMLERDQGHLIKQNNLPDPLYDLLLSFHRVVYKTNMKVVDPLSITS